MMRCTMRPLHKLCDFLQATQAVVRLETSELGINTNTAAAMFHLGQSGQLTNDNNEPFTEFAAQSQTYND